MELEAAPSLEKPLPGAEDTKREAFGNRKLTDSENVYKFNAWDNVEWDEELIEQAVAKIKVNSSVLVPQEKAENFEKNAGEFWNKFYGIHDNKFFKDRNWLFTEFPELLLKDDVPESSFKILEVGCGVGNTVFPIVRSNKNPNLYVYGCDFSSTAIDVLKQSPDYDEAKCKAFVCDITDLHKNEFPINKGELDLIVMIFVFSAIKPEKMLDTMKNMVKLLKPGGKILFRDYGLYDLAQLRFKPGQCIENNFYVRGDGTFVKFFSQDDMDKLFTDCGLVKEQNVADKRLQINRGKQLKMYRVWIQCKYMKPI